jgi:hypothetical protein
VGLPFLPACNTYDSMPDFHFPDLFANIAAEEAKRAGMARVAANATDYTVAGLAAITAMTGEFIGEDVRAVLLGKGVVPPHPNAHGSLINLAARYGLIVHTGRYAKPKGVKSHARESKVWRRT